MNAQTIHKVEQVVTGATNPLFDLAPPTQIHEVQNLVLVQAQEIKLTLKRIFERDPTARCHSFPFTIYDENKILLEKNGYKVEEARGGYSRVSWSPLTQTVVTIPTASQPPFDRLI